jgi:hypothetical protein
MGLAAQEKDRRTQWWRLPVTCCSDTSKGDQGRWQTLIPNDIVSELAYAPEISHSPRLSGRSFGPPRRLRWTRLPIPVTRDVRTSRPSKDRDGRRA